MLLETISTFSNPAETARLIITSNQNWIPLKNELDIIPGSAVDFSQLKFTDPPAGKWGRLIANQDGKFVFEKKPDQPQRFYGVNLCFSALYLTHDASEKLAERLLLLGYNSVRIHHYESELIKRSDNQIPGNIELDSTKIDAFDYLFAQLAKRGFYMTTDLFVSRPVLWKDIGIDKDGQIPMDTFKILVPVHEGAWQNWKYFTKIFLMHTNKYTGKAYAQDPALAWLSMINEGIFANFLKQIREFDEWKFKWNNWLKQKYLTIEDLKKSWNAELNPIENFGQIQFPDSIFNKTKRAADCLLFFSELEQETVQKMKNFIRNELNCKALISNANAWTYFVSDQLARNVYDYVDDHFYVEHPEFIEKPWRLPSRSSNTNPLKNAAPGPRNHAFTRLYGKPFTISEFNYCAPGEFRAAGGLLMGCFAALQDMDAAWRFAYSHSRNSILNSTPLGYFDLVSDPLNQASDRAVICLFLRRDAAPAAHKIAIGFNDKQFFTKQQSIPQLFPEWSWAAWITQVGTLITDKQFNAIQDYYIVPLSSDIAEPQLSAPNLLKFPPYNTDNKQVLTALKSKGIVGPDNITDLDSEIYQSDTAQLLINSKDGSLYIDTPRSAGVFGLPDQKICLPTAAMEVQIRKSHAAVWITTLDHSKIQISKRMLLTHLTDVQNSEIVYGDKERKTLMAWGKLPHLARYGEATIKLRLAQPQKYKVWALALNGSRIKEIEKKITPNSLTFDISTAIASTNNAVLLYEICLD